MGVNPNPAYITAEMWRLWESRPNKNWKLGGIYADKKGYHNTVAANKRHWPGNYSIKLPLDLVPINNTKARAIDTTKSTREMVKWTKNMRDSALDPQDNRLAAVKEFYGTLDGKTVYGLSKDSIDGEWREVTADTTHLWHGHTSIFTAFVANWVMLAPILSVWAGEPFYKWREGQVQLDIAKLNDIGETVKYWQYIHNCVRNTVSPPCKLLDVDGHYGEKTADAFLDFWKKSGGTSTNYKGTYITGWLAAHYQIALFNLTAPKPQAVDETVMKAMVNDWLATNIPAHLVLIGDVKGSVQLPK